MCISLFWFHETNYIITYTKFIFASCWEHVLQEHCMVSLCQLCQFFICNILFLILNLYRRYNIICQIMLNWRKHSNLPWNIHIVNKLQLIDISCYLVGSCWDDRRHNPLQLAGSHAQDPQWDEVQPTWCTSYSDHFHPWLEMIVADTGSDVVT